jgi:hypothetical protein
VLTAISFIKTNLHCKIPALSRAFIDELRFFAVNFWTKFGVFAPVSKLRESLERALTKDSLYPLQWLRRLQRAPSSFLPEQSVSFWDFVVQMADDYNILYSHPDVVARDPDAETKSLPSTEYEPSRILLRVGLPEDAAHSRVIDNSRGFHTQQLSSRDLVLRANQLRVDYFTGPCHPTCSHFCLTCASEGVMGDGYICSRCAVDCHFGHEVICTFTVPYQCKCGSNSVPCCRKSQAITLKQFSTHLQSTLPSELNDVAEAFTTMWSEFTDTVSYPVANVVDAYQRYLVSHPQTETQVLSIAKHFASEFVRLRQLVSQLDSTGNHVVFVWDLAEALIPSYIRPSFLPARMNVVSLAFRFGEVFLFLLFVS